jgi:hypothetical protein
MTAVLDSEGAAWLAAVVGELLQAGDLPFAFEADRVVGREALDQPRDPVADLQREVGGRRAGEGADVLDRDALPAAEQLWVLRLAHSSLPIFANSATSLTSACCSTLICPVSPMTHTWL